MEPWANLPTSFNHLIFFDSMLSSWTWPQYLISFHNKYGNYNGFVPASTLSSSQVSAHEKRKYEIMVFSP